LALDDVAFDAKLWVRGGDRVELGFQAIDVDGRWRRWRYRQARNITDGWLLGNMEQDELGGVVSRQGASD
jgi:hypothetical protein